ncbi:MAG: hypothetical protein SF052_23830 [Bacteroidia bacterium]|nr:hypothetical protein [Bacteroidia bacterium]
MESRARSFPLKNGYCHLYPDHIQIEQDDISGKILYFLEKKGFSRNWIIYLSLSGVMTLATLIAVQIENYFLAAFFAAFSVANLIAAFFSRKVSFASQILREHITSVEYKEAVEGVSRASFTIFFRPKRTILKRNLALPSYRKGDTQIAQAAYYMMKEEKLIE